MAAIAAWLLLAGSEPASRDARGLSAGALAAAGRGPGRGAPTARLLNLHEATPPVARSALLAELTAVLTCAGHDDLTGEREVVVLSGGAERRAVVLRRALCRRVDELSADPKQLAIAAAARLRRTSQRKQKMEGYARNQLGLRPSPEQRRQGVIEAAPPQPWRRRQAALLLDTGRSAPRVRTEPKLCCARFRSILVLVMTFWVCGRGSRSAGWRRPRTGWVLCPAEQPGLSAGAPQAL